MKKLVLMLAVAFSVSLFSCGNGDANKAADTVDSTAAAPVEAVEETVVAEEVVVDSAAAPVDSAAAATAEVK